MMKVEVWKWHFWWLNVNGTQSLDFERSALALHLYNQIEMLHPQIHPFILWKWNHAPILSIFFNFNFKIIKKIVFYLFLLKLCRIFLFK